MEKEFSKVIDKSCEIISLQLYQEKLYLEYILSNKNWKIIIRKLSISFLIVAFLLHYFLQINGFIIMMSINTITLFIIDTDTFLINKEIKRHNEIKKLIFEYKELLIKNAFHKQVDNF